MLKDLSAPYVAVDGDSDQANVTITLRGDLNITTRSALSELLTEHLKQDLNEHLAQLPGSQPRSMVGPATLRRPATTPPPPCWSARTYPRRSTGDELDDPSLRPGSFAIRDFPRRLAERGDLFRTVLIARQVLPPIT